MLAVFSSSSCLQRPSLLSSGLHLAPILLPSALWQPEFLPPYQAQSQSMPSVFGLQPPNLPGLLTVLNNLLLPCLLDSTQSLETLQGPLPSQWPAQPSAKLFNRERLSPSPLACSSSERSLCQPANLWSPHAVCEASPLWLCGHLSCGLCAPTDLPTSPFTHSATVRPTSKVWLALHESQPSWLVSDFLQSRVIGWMLP